MAKRPAVSRRSFLTGAAAVAALAAAGPGPRRWALGSAVAAEKSADVDVVVVGAGAAGLAAAKLLLDAKRRVVVFEAMDRKGGRLWTNVTEFGTPFDEGGAWIHAADRNPLYNYARANNFDLVEHDLDVINDAFYLGRKFTAKELASLNETTEILSTRVRATGALVDEPALVAAPVTTPDGRIAETFLGPMDTAVDFGFLSSADYARLEKLDPNYLVKQGYGAVLAKFGADVPVRTSTPVRRIQYGANGVAVECGCGTVRARAAIVTVSTGVLAAERIRFDPPLPAWKQDAIDRLPMGLLAKVAMRTDGARFGLKPYEIVMCERAGPQNVYLVAFPFDTDMLIGFVGGDFAWQLTAAGPQAAEDFMLDTLGRCFGSDAPRHVNKTDFTGWGSNPWTRGAYSAAVPGHAEARAELARPLGRLFFAGEATADGLAQTAGGAFVNGRETAAQVLKLFG